MPALLRKWALERATGTFTVSAPHPATVVCTVLVEDGGVVFATSRSKKDPTGELYLMLFQVPSLDSEDVDEVERVGRQVMSVVTDLFDWSVAEIGSHDGINLLKWPRIELSVADMLLQGMRRISDVNRIRRWLGDPEQVFVRAGDPFAFFRNASLKPEEAYFISRIDGPMTIRDMEHAAGVEETVALNIGAALLFGGIIEPATVAQPRAGNTGTFKAVPKVDPAEAARFWYIVESKLRAIEAGHDYYRLLEIERRSPTSRVESSYTELTRTFHPDEYRHLAPLYVDVDSKLDAIFKSLTAAYAVLSNPVNRAAYDRMLAENEKQSAVRVDPPTHRTGPIPTMPRPSPEPPPAPQAPLASPSTPSGPESEPSVVKKVPTLTAAEWYKRGMQFLAAKDLERASSSFERGIELAPDNPHLHAALGAALTRQGVRMRRAEEVLQKAIKLAPFASAPVVDLGFLYVRGGKRNDARSCFERALKIKPDDARARRALDQLDQPGGTSGLLKKLFGS